MVGEDMMRCISFMEMKNSNQLFPFLRTAMLLEICLFAHPAAL